MAEQPNVVVPAGGGIDFGGADVDHLVGSDGNAPGDIGRPDKNLAYRDTVVASGLNEAIDRANNAFAGSAFIAASSPGNKTPEASLEAMLLVEHNVNGTHQGGSPHDPVTIGGISELTLASQLLGVNVDQISGSLAAGDDTRFIAYVGPSEVYTTPKAAIDAGESFILIQPGSYDDTTAGAISVNYRVWLQGLGSVTWNHDGLTVTSGGEGSTISGMVLQNSLTITLLAHGCTLQGLTMSGTSATINVSTSHNTIRYLTFTGVSAAACLTVSGDRNHISNVQETVLVGSNGQSLVTISGDYNELHHTKTTISGGSTGATDYRVQVTGDHNLVRGLLHDCDLCPAIYITGSYTKVQGGVVSTGISNFAVISAAQHTVVTHCDFRGFRGTAGTIDALVVTGIGVDDLTVSHIDVRCGAVGAAGTGAQVLVRIDEQLDGLLVENVQAERLHAVVTNLQNVSFTGTNEDWCIRGIRCRNMTSAILGGAYIGLNGKVLHLAPQVSVTFRGVELSHIDASGGAAVIESILEVDGTAVGFTTTVDNWTVSDIRCSSASSPFWVHGDVAMSNWAMASIVDSVFRGFYPVVFFSVERDSISLSFAGISSPGACLLLRATGAANVIHTVTVAGCSGGDTVVQLSATGGAAVIRGVAISGCSLHRPGALGATSFMLLHALNAGDSVLRVVVSGGIGVINSGAPVFDATGAGTKSGYVSATGYLQLGAGGLSAAGWILGTDVQLMP